VLRLAHNTRSFSISSSSHRPKRRILRLQYDILAFKSTRENERAVECRQKKTAYTPGKSVQYIDAPVCVLTLRIVITMTGGRRPQPMIRCIYPPRGCAAGVARTFSRTRIDGQHNKQREQNSHRSRDHQRPPPPQQHSGVCHTYEL